MEQPTIAAATVVRMTILKTLCSSCFSIFRPGGKDQIDHTHLNAVERTCHHRKAEELVKEQRDQINDREGRKTYRHRGRCRTCRTLDLVADIGGTVHRHRAGRRLRNCHHVQKFFFCHPLFLFHKFVLQQSHHGITAAKRERTNFEKRPEKLLCFRHSLLLSRALLYHFLF